MRRAVMSLVLALSLVSGIDAGTDPKFHLVAGAGLGSAGDATGVSVGINASIVQSRTVFSFRAIGCSEFRIFGKNQSAVDFSVLTGLRKLAEHTELSIEGGVGYVRVHNRETYVTNDPLYPTGSHVVLHETVGLAIQGKLFWRGIGSLLYGNINGDKSYAGALLVIRLGKW
jgi:hypothetical protein